MVMEYTLTMVETIRYYEMVARMDPSMKKSMVMTILVLPAILVIIGCVFQCFYSVIYWMIAIVAIILWIGWIYPYIFRIVIHHSAQKIVAAHHPQLRPIHLSIGDSIVVDGQTKQLMDYQLYADLVILDFDDTSHLIVPYRIFKDDQAFHDFTKSIILLKEAACQEN